MRVGLCRGDDLAVSQAGRYDLTSQSADGRAYHY